MDYCNDCLSLYGKRTIKTFTDEFEDASTFLSDYKTSALYNSELTDNLLTQIYYLLYSRYGNSHIAGKDEDQWKYRVYTVLYQYGPTWARNMDIQKTLRTLDEDDILAGSKQIANHAYNPSTQPSSDIIEEINEQNTIKYSKSKLDGYALLASLLEKDVTEEFLGKFKRLFVVIIEPEYPEEN